jgi:uncharacterized membrane protein YkoI
MSHRMAPLCMAEILLVSLLGCGTFSHGGERGEDHGVALADLTAPARATVERLTAGGTIRKIECERKGRATVYDVEAAVGGKDVEYDVDAGGNVLTSEQSVAYDTLPAAVRSAAENQFGTSKALTASTEQESGKVFYEVDGVKDGVETALKMTADGKIVEAEHE